MSTSGEVPSIVLFVVSGVVIIVVAILVTKCYLRRMKQRRSRSRNPLPPPSRPGLGADSIIELGSVEEFLDGILKEKPIRFTPQHLIDCTWNYSVTLGSGGFGTVYKGVLLNGVQVAVKVLRGTSDKRAEEQQFMAEVGTIGRTYHINLVKLYGFCFDETAKALVYEYMEKGSLEVYLFGKERTVIEFEKLRDIAVGTAKGLRYLHEECQQKIVHYDIKPANVLLDANFCPKVADFGLAKLCDRENTHMAITGGGRGTPGYAAPELWMPFPVTHKCDVYSYGMLLFEIVGRRRNLEFSRGESQKWFPTLVWEKFQQGQLESIVSLCGIEEHNRDKAGTMCQVALWCVQYQPEARPSMSSVVRMLEGDEEIVPPTNPFLHMMSNPAVSSSVTSKSETASEFSVLMSV
ncbi:putative G-type lectin S-receptor-like serine/threonine-protein kinase [Iris pallida]|uniref:G-type lectin S-receptor-like serine/threonine-protein kinase n=1 Tax=Iris pallida TaxID=29817 RepID=A0AAX6DVQ1_IRIPA|nr:putative G-type lectin S-receptor-like serine/threonine-protein kinase [Iris pallida]